MVSGIPITPLAIGIFNGMILESIVYIVFWVVDSSVFRKEPTATVKVKIELRRAIEAKPLALLYIIS